jgi:8-oxo-dGTP pyrophosphatase MutT (NUDIX family)
LAHRLSQTLTERQPQTRTEWEARPAAVILPLYHHEGSWWLLFTRRAELLAEHSGQVAFPGGRIDAGETAEQAALREIEEEIGIQASEVTILGQLDPLLTVTQFLIHPVVAEIRWPTRLSLNPAEVARVFGVPLQWLAASANLERRERQSPFSTRPVQVYTFKRFDGEQIWGATARLTVQLLAALESAE